MKKLPRIIFTLIGGQQRKVKYIKAADFNPSCNNALSDADSRRSLSYVLGHSITTDFHGNKDG